MAEEITLDEFNQLPLEERVKFVIRDFFYHRISINFDKYTLGRVPLEQHAEAYGYAIKNKYIEKIKETPNSEIRIKCTTEGLNFMDGIIKKAV